MSTDTKASTAPSVSRTISHVQRAKSDDVNPLLQSSSEAITSADDNYIVGRQSNGALHHIVPGFKLPLKERLLKPLGKYYEVDKRSYQFAVTLPNMPSAQATFKFNVTLEFKLKVVDPCAIVREPHTSLLECIMLDLKRCVHDVTSRFHVKEADATRTALQTALHSFSYPAFLQMVCGVVDVMPDQEAARMMRTLEAKSLEVDVIGTQTEVDSAREVGKKITSAVVDNLEDHQLQAPINALVSQVLPGRSPT